ncbi:hypothetical protein PUNSTDRAFT_52550 [Punctularia strigosozonata HHB-11173 SS5]|uniref:uncharacterized protein n=1 Tax=Punctularia strigosozonata (strain HHB-11173) TaxID=741275 RepID=UPI0004417B76|nr:uncharacterized protein PUNSTDRAFT_52550 [Punctularia strigosozonata HHB-11173 SS5]EIN09213.1 hypothetical protein PUNSTDRAFT_52550 [Punctularia strigosozonata HHB-11173 SS5]
MKAVIRAWDQFDLAGCFIESSFRGVHSVIGASVTTGSDRRSCQLQILHITRDQRDLMIGVLVRLATEATILRTILEIDLSLFDKSGGVAA